MAIRQDINNFFARSSTPILTRIIVINILVFLVANLYASFSQSHYLFQYVALPSSPYLFLHRPWTLLTYMFLHYEFSHILFNLLWLYWMGRLFAEYMGEKRLIYTYIIGGFCGGLLFVLIYGVAFPQPNLLLGASAGIMAVIVAIATLIPDYEMNLLFIGPVKLKWVALASFIITSVVDFSVNSGGKVAHIGGAFYGLLYTWQYRKGNDFVQKLSSAFSSIGSIFKGSGSKKAKLTGTRGGRATPDKQRRIDDILDKISHSGYESLSKEEKDFLFKSSKDN